MTYGENSRELRDSMTGLLGRYRILYRLGGPGPIGRPPWSTEAERQRMGLTIQRYRLVALTWCLQAVTATIPRRYLSHTRIPRRDAIDLHQQLSETVAAARVSRVILEGQPITEMLATNHGNELLDAWQRLARAAALGEHDFMADVRLGYLDPAQARTVIKDSADLCRALVLLDRRYVNVPGWQSIPGRVRLEICAEATSRVVSDQERSFTVDARGWRPPPVLVTDPMLPGVAGSVQSQANLLSHLGHSPHALNLRRILHSQAQVSSEAAKHATAAAPDLSEQFSRRALLYRDLVRASRDVGGIEGGGGLAVVDSQLAAVHLARPVPPEADLVRSLNELARLCRRTDAKVATIIEQGFTDKIYFIGVNTPHIDDHAEHLVHRVRQKWMPTGLGWETPLLELARKRLRPPPPPPAQPPRELVANRTSYEELLAREVGRLHDSHRR